MSFNRVLAALAALVFALPADYSGYRSLIVSQRPRPTLAAVLLLVVVLRRFAYSRVSIRIFLFVESIEFS